VALNSDDHPWLNTRKGFYPIHSIDGKENCKTHFRINRDGSVVQSIFLNIPNSRLREKIIFIHFIRSYVRWVIQDIVGLNIINRDEPWDFEVQLSNGDQFNLEIISIADNDQNFIINRREEGIDKVAHLPTIPLSQLKKISANFPTEDIEKIIKAFELAGLGKNDSVENPWFGEGKRILISNLPEPCGSLYALIEAALRAKANKPHTDKGQTFVIIDNRTSAFDIDDFHHATAHFEDFYSWNPFREVWFYTGYYSDNAGNNAEWSLAPILAPDETFIRLSHTIETDGLEPDQNGIIYSKMGKA
jgi:hypothetical protein